MDDSITVDGLAALLDDQSEPPYLELTLRCNGQEYRVAILAAGGEWAVRVADSWGKSCTDPEDLYATQADALLVALLIAIDDSRKHEESVRLTDAE
ncbi:MAG TPA: hypothetical protein VKX16_17160 [Chloroflexota bacterium]|nr:hypothetical protein [Chloroflexota bacterium]